MRNNGLAANATRSLAEPVKWAELVKLLNLLAYNLSQDKVPFQDIRDVIALLSDALVQERREQHATLIGSHLDDRGNEPATISAASDSMHPIAGVGART